MTKTIITIDVSQLGQNKIPQYHQEISKIYKAAFKQPPYNENEQAAKRFLASLEQHVLRSGFKCLAAYTSDNSHMVGFAFGYTAKAGQWWRDIVASAMTSQQIDRWLSDCFELAELAVLPSYQGKGIGGKLHDKLLVDIPHMTAVLSTIQAESNALHLYRKRGWITLVENLVFPGGNRKYMILGLDLKIIKKKSAFTC
jgi:ribosomal protein S18 acetylase RimI-like enzyme